MEPVNAIFVIVQYMDRTETMIEYFKETSSPLILKNYQNKIILIVTKFDQVDEDDE